MEPGYERLSRLDETFLSFETENTPMHIALTGIFTPRGLATAAGGVDAKRIRAHVASRLHRVPRYRQRLQLVPVLHDAIWVDDEAFDVDYHVRHASLPRPGSEEQLRSRCAEILERPLDRRRPLWEMWIIEGLAGGRFALLFKVHHCMVDGVGGVALLVNLLGTEPSTETEPPMPWSPRPIPGGSAMLGGEIKSRGRSLLDLGRRLTAGLTDPGALGRSTLRRASAVLSLASGGLRPKPATPINGPVGPHRRIAWMRLSLEEMKAIRQALGGTVNDVVLTTVAGGLGRFLAGQGVDTCRIACPVNLRGPGEGDRQTNLVSAWILELSLREKDTRRRYAAICETTAELKRTAQADGAQALLEAAEWAGAPVLHAAIRLVSSRMPVHFIVTNVPGPPFPLYLLSARLESAYPFLPLFEGQGLGIALFRYLDEVFVGLTGEWDLLERLDELPEALLAAFEELRALAGRPTTALRPKPSTSTAKGTAPRRLAMATRRRSHTARASA